MRKLRLNLKFSMTGRISVQPKTQRCQLDLSWRGVGGGFSMMTYISPKPVAMQGLSTWAMSQNVIASRKGTTGM